MMTTPTTAPIESPSLRTPLLVVAVVGAVLTVLCTPQLGFGFSRGVAIGSALAAANLWVIARVVRSMLGQGGAAGFWATFAAVKMFALFGAVYWFSAVGVADPVALLIGYGSLPIGLVLAQGLVAPTPAPSARPPRD